MEFAPPIWVTKRVCYKFKINESNNNYTKSFIFATELGLDQLIPTSSDVGYFEANVEICKEFLKTYAKWFPGRVTQIESIMSNLKNVWHFGISPDLKEGVNYQVIWRPIEFYFGGAIAEIHWSLIESSGISSEELVEAEFINLPTSSDTNDINIRLETRRDYRKRVRQARLKAALAELRATKMAEEYYRRYEGMDESEDSDLDKSGESDAAPGS
jgi:hypothetical protein